MTHLHQEEPEFSDLSSSQERDYEEIKERFEYLLVGGFKDLQTRQGIEDAMNLAVMLHYEQEPRPDGAPYWTHPIEVATTVLWEFGIKDPDMIKAALLHDVVEDQAEKLVRLFDGTTEGKDIEKRALEIIEQQFGLEVASYVAALTNPDLDDQAALRERVDPSKTFREHKNQAYSDHVFGIAIDNPNAFLIKYADLKQNAFRNGELPPGELKQQMQDKYRPTLEMILDYFIELREGDALSDMRLRVIGEVATLLDQDY